MDRSIAEKFDNVRNYLVYGGTDSDKLDACDTLTEIAEYIDLVEIELDKRKKAITKMAGWNGMDLSDVMDEWGVSL